MSEKKRILVVDDDPDILEQVETILSGEGYDVVPAATQAEAEDLMLSARPDLAVVDLMMENTDSGFVLCHEIKKVHPDTPVIFLTAVRASTGIDFNEATPQARSWLKAEKILDKPVRPEQLRAEVRRLLGGASEADAHDKHP